MLAILYAQMEELTQERAEMILIFYWEMVEMPLAKSNLDGSVVELQVYEE